MKKKNVSIEWSSMSGMGPRAWDRDEARLSIHESHEHPSEKHHIVYRQKNRTQAAGTSRKADSNRRKAD